MSFVAYPSVTNYTAIDTDDLASESDFIPFISEVTGEVTEKIGGDQKSIIVNASRTLIWCDKVGTSASWEIGGVFEPKFISLYDNLISKYRCDVIQVYGQLYLGDFHVFDIKLCNSASGNERWLSFEDVKNFCTTETLTHVPFVERGNIRDLINGAAATDIIIRARDADETKTGRGRALFSKTQDP